MEACNFNISNRPLQVLQVEYVDVYVKEITQFSVWRWFRKKQARRDL